MVVDSDHASVYNSSDEYRYGDKIKQNTDTLHD